MNTRLMALDYIKRASTCFKESKDAFNDEDYPITIRRAQECVELCLKAVLRGIAIEYPREHDVSKALEMMKGKIPDWFSSKLQKFMDVSVDLSKKRGPALYGYEAELRPASDVFVLPSLSEWFPVTVVEAMASGLPIVATDVRGLPEIIKSAENGFLVEPNYDCLPQKTITDDGK